MGIAFILRDYTENLMFWYTAYIGLHLLFMVYFAKVHGLIFRNMRQDGGKAVVLNLIGVGLGQAYNRQLIKGIVFLVIFLASVIALRIELYTKDEYVWIFLGIYAILLIDAYRSSFKAERRSLIQSRTKELQTKSKALLQYRNQGHQFGVDTNILMHEPDLLVYLLEKESFDLYMSMMVFSELDGLKKNEDPVTRKKAQVAFDVIEEFQRRNKLYILKTPKTDDIRKYGLSGSPDEKIIGTYLRERDQGKEKLIFLSNDKGARIIARNVGMPVVEI